MNPVLDASPENAGRGKTHDPRTCPECMATFQPVDRGQLFCSPTHRRAWNNRWVTRGAVVAPLAAVARLTRQGSRGRSIYARRASVDADVLFRRWKREDEAAGRMSWLDYIDARYRLGFDPIR